MQEVTTLDLESGKMQWDDPTLPNVSVKSLVRIRKLLSAPGAVTMNFEADSLLQASSQMIAQLRRNNLVDENFEHRVIGLYARSFEALLMASMREFQAPAVENQTRPRRNSDLHSIQALDPAQRRDKSIYSALSPIDGEEAMSILVAQANWMESDQEPVIAFARFKQPINLFLESNALGRFLCIMICPTDEKSYKETVSMGRSLAGIMSDERLLMNLTKCETQDDFLSNLNQTLDKLAKIAMKINKEKMNPNDETPTKKKKNKSRYYHTKYRWLKCKQNIQAYSLPLITGVVLAVLIANVNPEWYADVFSVDGTATEITPGHELYFDHHVNLHFLVNDIFMVLFFGLAVKEISEAVLPGGALNPPGKALSPLVATFGGVFGPVFAFLIFTYISEKLFDFGEPVCSDDGGHRILSSVVDDHAGGDDHLTDCATSYDLEALQKGWGIPTATDISLAWMVAVQVFGAGHPAVFYLLLLAVVDDGLGLMIIAIFYPDPHHPVQPAYLSLCVIAVLLAYGFRRLHIMRWEAYVFVCGPISWFGLLSAGIHPALALLPIVPLMPDKTDKTHDKEEDDAITQIERALRANLSPRGRPQMSHGHDPNAPLHKFEHDVKFFVDCGMFFFSLANAGIQLTGAGPMTYCVLMSLLVGKIGGIFLFAYAAHICGVRLPTGVTLADLAMVGFIASIGLTVALFVAGEAYSDENLSAQAKFGALLSGLVSIVAIGIGRVIDFKIDHKRNVDVADMAYHTGLSESIETRDQAIGRAYGEWIRRQISQETELLPYNNL